MKIKSISALIVIMITLPVSFASAEIFLPDGQYTLDISIPNDSNKPFVGGRMFIDEDTAIESSVVLNLQSKDSGSGTESGPVLGGTVLGISAGIMKYLSRNRVSPYLRAGGELRLYFGDAYKNTDTLLRGRAGLGAEYMITKELSIRASLNGVLQLSPNFTLMTSTQDIVLSFFF